MPEKDNERVQKYVIAIDTGNSSTKVGIVNQDGKVVAQASGKYDIHFLPNGGAEQVPDEWWQIISAGIKNLISQSGVSPSEIVAIGTTSMWAVTVPVDQNGDPLMNAISWMDSRGGKYNIRILKGFPSIQGYGIKKLLNWINIVGLPPTLDGSESLGHMLYIKNECPEIYRQTYKFLEPMDFINMRLTGHANATINSNVGSFMIDYRKLDTRDYAPWPLKQSGLDRSKLPDLLPVEGIVGNLKESLAVEWGLSPDTIVITSANDNSVSAIGSGAIADYEAVAVLGTSGMLVFHFPGKKTDVIHSLATMPSALSNKRLFSADTGNTCRVIDSFLMNLVYGNDAFYSGDIPEDVYIKLNHVVSQVPVGSNGVLFLPWFTGGALAPTIDPFLRGGFINLSAHTTRKDLARAMLEGITYNWRWLKEAAEGFSKRKFPYWRITGGGARSDVWAQMMADVLGIPIYQQDDPGNSTLIGMAFLAFNRLGLMSLEEIPTKVKTKRIFEPIKGNQVVYDDLYSQFRHCTKQMKPIFHSMNKNI